MDLNNSELAAKASALLALDRHIVGVKFAYDREAYEKMAGRAMRARIAYCVVVKAAMAGKSLKLSREHSGCNGSSRALGFSPPTDDFTNGERYHSLGLYKDLQISKQVANSMTICRKSCFGVMAQPIEEYDNVMSDVVILATNARNGMRLLQGYTYIYGAKPVFTMTGNQAICVECTSYPLEKNRMNLSMLCSGTRYLAKWHQDQIAVGFPYRKFVKTVEGLLQTVNAVELDPAKRRIQEKLINQGLPDPHFHLGHTYYTELKKERALMRKKKS